MHGGAWRRSQRKWFAAWQEKGEDRGRRESHNRQERKKTHISPKWKLPQGLFWTWFSGDVLEKGVLSKLQSCSAKASELFSLFSVAVRKKKIWYRFISSYFLLLQQWFGKFNHQAACSAPSQSSFCAARHVGHCAPSPSQPSWRGLWKSFSLATFLLECLKHFFFVSAWLSSLTTLLFCDLPWPCVVQAKIQWN